MKLPEVQQRLKDDGAEVRLMTPEEFNVFIRAENSRWIKVIKDAGITPQ